MCEVSNFVYSKTKQAILNGEIDFASNNFKVLLVDSSEYTPNQASDEFLSDITVNARVYTTSPISSLTNTLGVIDGDDISITLPSNYAFEALVLFQDGTSDANARLIMYIDTAEGLPFVGTSEQVSMTIVWSNTSTKILSI